MWRPVLAVSALALLPCATVTAVGPSDVDRAFGVDGTVVTRIGPLVPAGQSLTVARDVEVQPDGKILVAGSAPGPDGGRAVALVRYRPDGRPDAGFGVGGTVVAQLGSTSSSAAAVALEADGGFVVTGTADAADGDPAVLVARFGPDGVLAFSLVDEVGTGEAPRSAGADVALQDDGRIVVAGRATAGATREEPFVARYSAGARDTTFGGGNGAVIATPDRSNPGEGCAFGDAGANAVIVLATGQIVAGGTIGRTCGERSEPVALLRGFSPLGVPVPGFGQSSPGLSHIGVLEPGPDGTLLAGGALGGLPGAARYLPDGNVDGPPGDQFLPPNGFGSIPGLEAGVVVGLRRQGGARVIAAVDAAAAGPDHVVRLQADGARDASFSAGGLGTAGVSTVRAVALQDDDVIAVGERAPVSAKQAQSFVVTRLHGGTQASRVSVGATGRIRSGTARVKLRCSPGPGCRGLISGAKLGPTSYEMRGGSRDVAEVPVAPAARRRPSIRVRVTNAPAPVVTRSISLG